MDGITIRFGLDNADFQQRIAQSQGSLAEFSQRVRKSMAEAAEAFNATGIDAGMSGMERKLQERAAGIERAALKSGLGKEMAAKLGDDFSDAILSGRTAEAEMIWGGAFARIGDAGAKSAGRVASAWSTIAKGATYALLPDMWVNRARNLGLSMVGAGISATALVAVLGTVAVAAGAAYFIWKSKQDEANASAKLLNDTLRERLALLSDASERHDMFARSGVEFGAVGEAWTAAKTALQSYNEALAETVTAQKRIYDGAASVASAQAAYDEAVIRKSYAPKINAAAPGEERDRLIAERDRQIAELKRKLAANTAQFDIGALEAEREAAATAAPTDAVEKARAAQAKIEAERERYGKLIRREYIPAVGMGYELNDKAMQGGTALDQAIRKAEAELQKMQSAMDKLREKDGDSAISGEDRYALDRQSRLVAGLKNYKDLVDQTTKAREESAKVSSAYDDAERKRLEKLAAVEDKIKAAKLKDAARAIADETEPEDKTKPKKEKTSPMERPMATIADSLAKVGGGGRFVAGGPVDPLIALANRQLSETQRQTKALETIADATKRDPAGTARLFRR